LSGYAWAPRFVDFFGGETRSPAFRALNPMGEVPVLVDGDLTLSQSGAIQFHVAEATGKLGGAPRTAPRCLRWVLWDNHKLSARPHDAVPDELPARRQAPEPSDRLYLQGRPEGGLCTLNRHLGGPRLDRGRCAPRIADCACCGYLYYPEPFGFDRADWPNIDPGWARLSQLPGWKHPYDLMPGSP
jgi:glutathione S-transferase